MGFLSDFKKFAVRGNILDLAVGIIIGAAFGTIVSSFVADIFTPPLGLLLGNVDFADLKIVMKPATFDAAGKIIKEAVSINYGKFIQAVLDFVIIAFCIFLLVRTISKLQKKEVVTPAPPVKSDEVILLEQIRDALVKK